MVQMNVTKDKMTNLIQAEQMIKRLSDQGADMVSLPESFNCPYTGRSFQANSEMIPDGITTKTLSRIAKENEVYLIGGSYPEKVIGQKKVYNTCVSFNRKGEVIGKYRKMHLFDVDIPGKYTFKESDRILGGNELCVIDTEFCKIGIAICYDVRFAELGQMYAERGCEMIVYPGTFTIFTGPSHWDLVLKGRAMETECYVAGISSARNEKSKFVCYAHSSVVSPWGEIVKQMDEKSGTSICEIDLNYVQEVRSKLPVLKHRRDDVYKIMKLNNNVKK
ncbi:omega-amidase nit2 [Anaeramoeba flamelloides]|uniref:Omega-amidase nit2 n=1 Tax=Anaeramoeba flamelloides TaxID=1746091 RepID=A0ABQ8YM22_9EUKA|nr:omega-amidase nit2 [Anaeramoeba flamelloides]